MGTLNTTVDRALVKARAHSQHNYAQQDTQLLGIVNSILEDINKELQSIESSLVYSHSTITTVASTLEYTPSFTHQGFMDDGVWISDETRYLKLLSEADKVIYDYVNTTGEPEGYYLTEDGKVGFLWVPDDAYTVNVLYWKPLTEMTTMASDTLPWGGIWNRFIEEKLVMDLMLIAERDISQQAAIVSGAHNQALQATYQRGCRPRRVGSDFFSLDGY